MGSIGPSGCWRQTIIEIIRRKFTGWIRVPRIGRIGCPVPLLALLPLGPDPVDIGMQQHEHRIVHRRSERLLIARHADKDMRAAVAIALQVIAETPRLQGASVDDGLIGIEIQRVVDAGRGYRRCCLVESLPADNPTLGCCAIFACPFQRNISGVGSSSALEQIICPDFTDTVSRVGAGKIPIWNANACVYCLQFLFEEFQERTVPRQKSRATMAQIADEA